MPFEEVKSAYFLGIGGIGMSALARYFAGRGVRVSGYDKTPSALTDALMQEGMSIVFDDDPGKIPCGIDLVVRTPAIPAEHRGYQSLLQSGIPMMKRAEALGVITRDYPTIAVAGTHGKTSISTLLTHIYRTANQEVIAFLGGISKNYHTNFVRETAPDKEQTANSEQQGSVTCIAEADEYDRSFLHLHPDIAIITSIDPDHLDIYDHPDHLRQSFAAFARQVKPGGVLIRKQHVALPVNEPQTALHTGNPAKAREVTYALGIDPVPTTEPAPDFHACHIAIIDRCIHFDLVTPEGILNGFRSSLPGMFNLENAVAALAAAWLAGIREEYLRKALHAFQGVERRFDIRVNTKERVFIDDYAHHPEELKACIRAARDWYPEKEITGVFQPHLFSRTRDLALGFAEALALLDAVILLDIYPAREKPIPGVTSAWLLDMIPLKNKRVCEYHLLVDLIKERKPELLLTLGAGDIDKLVKPIEQTFH